MLIYLKHLSRLSIFVCLEKGHLIAQALGNLELQKNFRYKVIMHSNSSFFRKNLAIKNV